MHSYIHKRNRKLVQTISLEKITYNRSYPTIALRSFLAHGQKERCFSAQAKQFTSIFSWQVVKAARILYIKWRFSILTMGQQGCYIITESDLTLALDCPTCLFRKRNCLFRLLTSIVSRSIYRINSRFTRHV